MSEKEEKQAEMPESVDSVNVFMIQAADQVMLLNFIDLVAKMSARFFKSLVRESEGFISAEQATQLTDSFLMTFVATSFGRQQEQKK